MGVCCILAHPAPQLPSSSVCTQYNTALIIISCAKFSFGPSTCLLQCRKFSSKFASRFPADQNRSAITCTWCTPHTTAPEFFISWTVPDLFWKLQELVLLLLWKLQMQIGFILSPLELLGWSAGMCIAWFVNVGFHRWESESEAMDRSRGNKRNWYKYHHSTLVEKERISWNRWSARGLQYYIYIYICGIFKRLQCGSCRKNIATVESLQNAGVSS